MGLIDSASINYRQPINQAMLIAKDAYYGYATPLKESIKARCLFVSQVVVSIVTVPFLILGVLFSRVLRECNIDVNPSAALKRTFTVDIPGSCLGIFATLYKSYDVISEWDDTLGHEYLFDSSSPFDFSNVEHLVSSVEVCKG